MIWTQSIPLPTLLAISSAMGLLSAYLAHRQGRANPVFWFFIGFFLGAMGIVGLFFGRRKPKVEEAPKPQPVLNGPASAAWYYADADRQQRGPISREGLMREYQAGKVSGATLVWHEELSEWQPLQNFL